MNAPSADEELSAIFAVVSEMSLEMGIVAMAAVIKSKIGLSPKSFISQLIGMKTNSTRKIVSIVLSTFASDTQAHHIRRPCLIHAHAIKR